MPSCKLCLMRFPTYVTVSGIKVSLKTRRYCLTCKPLKSLPKKVIPQVTSTEATCHTCGRTYDYTPKNRKGHSPTVCNSCNVNNRRDAAKQRAIDYLGGKCSVCGYTRCNRALSFHHICGDKDFTIAGRYTCSWETLQAELDKCVLLCSNCHAEVHAGILDLNL